MKNLTGRHHPATDLIQLVNGRFILDFAADLCRRHGEHCRRLPAPEVDLSLSAWLNAMRSDEEAATMTQNP